MEDFGSLAATVGGALGAHATGGAQGLNAFLGGLQQRELAAAEREFKRESQARDQLFQSNRDQLQRTHELEMLDKRETAGEDKINRQMANVIVADALRDPARGTEIAAEMKGALPELAGTIDSIDWNNREVAVPVAEAYVGRIGAAQAGSRTSERGEEALARNRQYTVRTGLEAPSGFTNADALALETQHSAALGELQTATISANTFSGELNNIGNLPASERLGQLQALDAQMANAQKGLPALAESIFMGDPTFSAGVTSAMSSMDTVVSGAERLRRATAKEIAAGHDFKQGVASWQGFQPGYGGVDGEETLYQEALAASAPQLEQLDTTLALLHSTDQEILDALGYTKNPAILDAHDRSVGGDPGELLTAKTLFDEYRAASLGETPNFERMGQLDNQIKTLAAKTPAVLEADIGRFMARLNSVAATESALVSLNTGALESAGFGMDPEVALDRFGVVRGDDPTGAKSWDPVVSTKRMFSDPAVLDGLAQNLWVGLTDDPNFDVEAVADQRVRALQRQYPEFFGLESANALRTRLAGFSSARAGIGPLRSPVAELHGYDSTLPRRIQKLSPGTSYRTLLSADEQLQARQNMQSVVTRGGDPTSPTAKADLLTEALAITKERPKGQTKAVPLPSSGSTLHAMGGPTSRTKTVMIAEAEGMDPGRVSLPDIHALMQQFAPGYAQRAVSPGRFPENKEAQSYMTGRNSLSAYAAQYSDMSPDEVSALKRLDLMRALPLDDLAVGSTPEEYAMLQGLQTHLRTLDLPEARAMFFGEGAVGVDPERLGLVPGSMDAYEADRVSASVAVNMGDLDLPALHDEIKAIDGALADLSRFTPDTQAGRIVSLGDDYSILDEALLATNAEQLAADKELLERRINAKTQLMAKYNGGATGTVAVLHGSASFPTSAGELSVSLLKNRLLTSGESQDILSQWNTNTYTVLAQRLTDQPDASPFFLFQQLSDVVGLTSSQGEASLNRGTAIPQADRVALMEEQSRSFAHAEEHFMDLFDLIQRNPDFKTNNAAASLQPVLDRGDFDSMPSDTPDAQAWKAWALWSAVTQVHGGR